ncbi:MAG: hypothetical protein HXX18_07325 [Bacteroidetes bacterium]|nr:hypothetical protein [Bacteroidota bacterium]
MKKKLILLSLIFILIMLQSFVQIRAQNVITNLEVEFHELKPNEVDSFAEGPDITYNKYGARCKHGSNDGSGYDIEIDTTGRLKVTDLRECKGKHQNEINIFNCNGTISRNSDTIIISAKTIYDKFFLFSLGKKEKNESFEPNVRIQLICRTLNNEYCPGLVDTDGRVYIVALPKDVDTEDIYEPLHLDKNVGIFTYFAVYDTNGKLKVFPQGDYVLIGGNSLKITK